MLAVALEGASAVCRAPVPVTSDPNWTDFALLLVFRNRCEIDRMHLTAAQGDDRGYVVENSGRWSVDNAVERRSLPVLRGRG